MSNDDFMLSGNRERSRSYKVQRLAFNVVACAALVECAGVALRDIAHKLLWYRNFSRVAMALLALGVLLSVAAIGIGFFDMKRSGGRK